MYGSDLFWLKGEMLSVEVKAFSRYDSVARVSLSVDPLSIRPSKELLLIDGRDKGNVSSTYDRIQYLSYIRIPPDPLCYGQFKSAVCPQTK